MEVRSRTALELGNLHNLQYNLVLNWKKTKKMAESSAVKLEKYKKSAMLY